MKSHLKTAFVAVILSIAGISMADESLTTFCEDDPNVANTGFCTRLDPESANQSCVDSTTKQTCDGAG
jgi:hypothetical protein